MASSRRSIFWPILLAIVAAPFVFAFLVFLFGAVMAGGAGAAAIGAGLSAPRPLAGDVVQAGRDRAVDACEQWARPHLGAGELSGQILSTEAGGLYRVAVASSRGSANCEVRDQAGRARIVGSPRLLKK